MTQEARRHGSTDDWDAHWNAYTATNALNPAQVYRQELVFDLLDLDDSSRPMRLLELGSGSGELAAAVLRKRPDAEVVGLDLSGSAVEASRAKVPGASFFQQDFAKPMTLDERYKGWATAAVCSEVLEHLDDVEGMLRNVRPYFAPGCRLIITVPAGPMSAFDRHIGHRRHFTPELLERTLRSAGLDVEDVRGAGFPFFNLYRLSVVARGEALMKDYPGGDVGRLSMPAKAALRIFGLLFKMNTKRTRLGWQLVAVGVEPRVRS